MWLAETKGEIRPNTALKRQAAELWCEKMSTTAHGPWRYLFVPQRRFEMAIASGLKTFAQMAAAMVQRPPEPQLKLIPLDDPRLKKETFKTLLPVYSLRAAAGYFGGSEAVEPEGWVRADGIGRLDEKMFAARAVGRSMEPVIHDDDLLVFRANPAGTRQGKIVLARYRGPYDPETGGSFTVKKYSSETRGSAEAEWRHTKVVLSPLNPAFKPIVLSPDSEGDIQIIAEFISVLKARS
ncbi:MAG: S24 family peptidase [Chromatiales bacterium]